MEMQCNGTPLHERTGYSIVSHTELIFEVFEMGAEMQRRHDASLPCKRKDIDSDMSICVGNHNPFAPTDPRDRRGDRGGKHQAANYIGEHPICIIPFNGKGRLIQTQRAALRTRIKESCPDNPTWRPDCIYLTSPGNKNAFGQCRRVPQEGPWLYKIMKVAKSIDNEYCKTTDFRKLMIFPDV